MRVQQESGASLFKKRVHDLLILAQKFPARLQAVRAALAVDDGAVMQNEVQNCRCVSSQVKRATNRHKVYQTERIFSPGSIPAEKVS